MIWSNHLINQLIVISLYLYTINYNIIFYIQSVPILLLYLCFRSLQLDIACIKGSQYKSFDLIKTQSSDF